MNENLFTVLSPKPKTFDIVYNANNGVVKNHYLLKNIIKDYKSLFITYSSNVCEKVDLDQYKPTKMVYNILIGYYLY